MCVDKMLKKSVPVCYNLNDTWNGVCVDIFE